MSVAPNHPARAAAAVWRTFSREIRQGRAEGRCECRGECGLHSGSRCREHAGQLALFSKGTIVLTVAHVCPCAPPCMEPGHVLAMCQRCHLRLDAALHARHAAETRARRRDAARPLLAAMERIR